MTTIRIELPDATAQAARDAGLLTPQALERMLNDALKRRQAASSLLPIADRVAAAGIAPMPTRGRRGVCAAGRAEAHDLLNEGRYFFFSEDSGTTVIASAGARSPILFNNKVTAIAKATTIATAMPQRVNIDNFVVKSNEASPMPKQRMYARIMGTSHILF